MTEFNKTFLGSLSISVLVIRELNIYIDTHTAA